jgi:putative glycerol-1-phosphate prenyltransferase
LRILYISLLSGRNPQYLIGEHISSAPIINNLKLETIPTGYILLNTGKISSVAAISKTYPLPMDNYDIVLAHALAGQYLGMKLIYLEGGSGSDDTIPKELIQYIYNNIKIPIIVGGGINSTKDIKKIVNSGVSYIVIGNALENNITKKELKEYHKVIHEKE